ncbi:MAG: MmcQ/YjbR family DNA-binding protein [Pseudomonadales bacterium]
MAKTFPGTEEGTSYGTPAIRVGKKLMLRLHQKEDAIVLLINSVEEQQELIAKDPVTFFITDHYAGYPAILIRPTVPENEFRDLMEIAWRRVARKKDLAEYEK